MFASLAPYSKNITEQGIWPLDFDNEMLEKVKDRDDAQIVEDLQKSIEFWERIDAIRGEA